MNKEMINGKYGPVLMFSSSEATKGKARIELRFAVDDLSKEESQQLNWLSDYIRCFGIGGKKWSEMRNFYSGHFGLSYEGSQLGGGEIYQNRYWVPFVFHCSLDRIDECIEFIPKALYDVNFDNLRDTRRAKKALKKAFRKIDACDVDILARAHVDACFSKNDAFFEEIKGIGRYATQVKNRESNLDSLMKRYQQLYRRIVCGSAIVSLFCEDEYLDKAKNAVKRLVENSEMKPLKESCLSDLQERLPETVRKQEVIFKKGGAGSLTVRFRGSDYPSKEFAHECVLMYWLDKDVLKPLMRNANPSCVCVCTINPDENLMGISTEDDPMPKKSLEVVDACLKRLETLESDETITDEYVRELAQYISSEPLEDKGLFAKGRNSLKRELHGNTLEMRAQRLKYADEMTRDDFIAAGKRIYENSKNLKACIVTGKKNQMDGDLICNMSSWKGLMRYCQLYEDCD